MTARVAACALAALALGLAACAGDGGDRPPPDVRGYGGSARPGEGGPDADGAEGGGRLRLNVFLSPSGEPFRAGPQDPYPSAAWFARADTDHDGRLTLSELRADALRAFALFDADGNGVIDPFEVQHYEATIAPEILPRIGGLRAGEGLDDSLFKRGGGQGGGRGGRGGRRGAGGQPSRPAKVTAGDRNPEGAELYGMLAEPEPLTAADGDFDGSVSRAEWLARTDRRFALLDPTGRGYLTLADLPKPYAQQLLERRRAREAARAARAANAGKSPPS